MLSSALARDWSVAQDGAGDFATVTEALTVAGFGDTIELAPGMYDVAAGEEFPWYLPGGITVRGAGPDATVIDAGGADRLAFVAEEGVAVEGATFAGAEIAFWSSYGSELSLSDCDVSRNSVGVYSKGAVILDGVRFDDNTGSETFDVCAAVTASILFATDVTISGLSDADCSLAVTGVNEEYAEVSGLTVLDSAPVVLGGEGSSLSSSLLVGVRTGGQPACLAVSAGTVNSSTVVGCQASWAISADVVLNSIVAHNTGVGIHGSTAAFNLVYDNAGGDWNPDDLTSTLHNIAGDPAFRAWTDDGDFSNDDLRLEAGSLAIDAGSGDCPALDLAGVPRPQDGDGDGLARCDIGAYEWGELDQDGDGWFLDGGDCDDLDSTINPGAEELPYNGIDEDCDGADLTDVDGDDHDADHQGGDDCDDTDPDVHAGAWDIPGDGVDQDCDGLDSVDTDGDGWPDDQDCEPTDAAVHPGSPDDGCDGIDQDCDGAAEPDCDSGEPGADAPEGCGCDNGGGVGSVAVFGVAALMRRRRFRPTAPRAPPAAAPPHTRSTRTPGSAR